MLELQITPNSLLKQFILNREEDCLIQTNSQEEKIFLLIMRDLMRLGWEIVLKPTRIQINAPNYYDKNTIIAAMQFKRQEGIEKNKNWIEKNIGLARENLADGDLVWNSEIKPVVEVCTSQQQFNLFRIFRYYWSSPYSDYVGRRIKLLVRDFGLPNKPIIGIAALGSSIIHIPDRDIWIGWDTATRTKNLVYAMDAYVLGALPPYNYLLGGKLMSYIVASNEVREIYQQKYCNTVTNISKRKASDLACIFTTSLYGKSSQYNRIKYNAEILYHLIGETKGYGTLHLTDETFTAMNNYLKANDIPVENRFGDGPIWRMRVIRTVADLLGFDADGLLQHSFKRSIYAIPLASNFREFLKGECHTLDYFNYPIEGMIHYWRERWLNNRRTREEVKSAVIGFKKSEFTIS